MLLRGQDLGNYILHLADKHGNLRTHPGSAVSLSFRQIPVSLSTATHARLKFVLSEQLQQFIHPHHCAPGMGELPQETICAIASYLDKHDLRNFSLISRAFVAESQRQLFRTVVFSHYFHFLRWCKVITHGHPIIPSYIRVFIIFFSTWFSGPPTKNESDCYIMASRVFASFPNLEEIFLRSLTLRYPHQFSMVSNFCASAQSVRSLRIEASQCSPGLMTKFICLFPQLDDIHMEMVNATDGEPYDLPTPSPSFRGRGRITLAGDYCQHLRFLPLRFKYLYLTSFLFKPRGLPVEHNVSVLNDFIIICSPTLEHLTLCGESLLLRLILPRKS